MNTIMSKALANRRLALIKYKPRKSFYAPLALAAAILENAQSTINRLTFAKPPVFWDSDNYLFVFAGLEAMGFNLHNEYSPWLWKIVMIAYTEGLAFVTILCVYILKGFGAVVFWDPEISVHIIVIYMSLALLCTAMVIVLATTVFFFDDIVLFQRQWMGLCIWLMAENTEAKYASFRKITRSEQDDLDTMRFLFIILAIMIPVDSVLPVALGLDPLEFFLKAENVWLWTGAILFRIFALYLLLSEGVRVAAMTIAIAVGLCDAAEKSTYLWKCIVRKNPLKGLRYYRKTLILYSTIRECSRCLSFVCMSLAFVIHVGFTILIFGGSSLPRIFHSFCIFSSTVLTILTMQLLPVIGCASTNCEKELGGIKGKLGKRESYLAKRLRSYPVWGLEMGFPNYRLGKLGTLSTLMYFHSLINFIITFIV